MGTQEVRIAPGKVKCESIQKIRVEAQNVRIVHGKISSTNRTQDVRIEVIGTNRTSEECEPGPVRIVLGGMRMEVRIVLISAIRTKLC